MQSAADIYPVLMQVLLQSGCKEILEITAKTARALLGACSSDSHQEYLMSPLVDIAAIASKAEVLCETHLKSTVISN